ncbi:histone H1-like [Heterodontus francisci]|uniref:histone H1-like n=1 Tax=Heterodontus francisci TaxID=7792 RepID=UPI00355B3BBD
MASGDLAEGPTRGRKPRKRRVPPKLRQVGAPTMAGHILEAVSSSRERRGLSLAGVKKALSAAGYDVPRINSRVNQAVRNLVNEGSLLQTAGTGASGSFKINRQRQDIQSRPALTATAPRGGQQRAAASGGTAKREKKRTPAEKNKPVRRKKNGTAGGRRKAAKGTGGRSGPRRGVGRPRKAAREPAPDAGPPGGQEAEQQPGGESSSEGTVQGGKP